MNNESVIIGGDWNVLPDMDKDTYRYRGGNRPRARLKIAEMLDLMKLKDIWRELNPTKTQFTWRRFNSVQQGRLDYFVVSESLIQNTISAKIEPGYRTDHSIITLELELSSHCQKPSTYWKFNNSLLRDSNYVKTVEDLISNIKKQYSVLVYNMETIDSKDCNALEFLVNDALFFDTLLMEIRGKTIAYSSYKKKEAERVENNLIKEIENIEKQLNSSGNVDLLETKKEELQSLRKHRIDGIIVRSRTQWSLEGERNSRYFCNLEKRHYTDKCMSTLEIDNGQITNCPTRIKEEVHMFYENLYKSREHCTTNVDLSPHLVGPKLNNAERDRIKGLTTIEEAGKALKKMKNGKSPGIDGYTTEFFLFLSGKTLVLSWFAQ